MRRTSLCALLLVLSLHAAPADLAKTDWRLAHLAGRKLVDGTPPTLSFTETGRVAGNASCNRFSGPVEITGEHIKFGPLITTRMACPQAVLQQEKRFLAALARAERYQRSGTSLLLFVKGSDKPLRFENVGGTVNTPPSGAGLDLDKLFGRIWQRSDSASNPAPHSIYVFLANGTLLETSCGERYRVATWTAERSSPPVLHVTEDGLQAFSAVVNEVSGDTLHLHQTLTRTGEIHDLAFRAITAEFVCPDASR